VAIACPESALFCDDFEDAALGAVAAPWEQSVNQATVNVDEVQAYSGTKAVHVNAPQAGTYHRGYISLDDGSNAGIFPAVAQEMYGRAMMYLPVLPNADVHWTFIQGEGAAAGEPAHNALYRYGGQHQNGAQLMANYETTNGVATDCWDHSATLLPVAAWTCVEWRFSVATNEMQFWMNGTELTDIHVTGAGEGCGGNALEGQWTAPPAFQTLYLGWEHYQQTQNPIDLWVDDVAVGTERLGCPPAP
jgi:polysaccharide lyase-like protein